MTALTVLLPDDGVAASAHRAVLASLPRRFRVVDGTRADVHVVSGRHASWVAAAQRGVDARVRAIVLTEMPAGTGTRHALNTIASDARAAGIVVGVDQPYATDPAWRSALGELAEASRNAAILDSVITVAAGTGAPLDAALLAQLATIRPLLGTGEAALRLRRTETHYVVSGGYGTLAVELAGVVSAAGVAALRIDLVGIEQRCSADLPADTVAEPSRVSRFDATGEHAIRARYEGSRRAGWAGLHAAIESGGRPAYSIVDLLDDLALLDDMALLEAITPNPPTP